MPEITYEYVTGLRRHLVESWSLAHHQWAEWHALHDQQHKIRYAKPADVRKLGIVRAKISAMVDTLVTTKPVVTRESVAEGDAHDKKADKVEKWATGLLERIATSGGPVPPFRTAATYLSLLGYAAGMVRWDDKLWDATKTVKRGPGYRGRMEEAQRQQERAFPYVLEFPHPARILMPHEERRPSVCIEIASMYGWQVEKMLEREAWEKLGDLHAKPYDILEVMNYWDEDKRGLFLAETLVEVRENGLGEVPAVHAFAGYGFERMPAIGLGSPAPASGNVPSLGPRPENLAEGLLAGAEDSIKALDEFSTALGFLVNLAAYAQYATTGDAEEMQRKLEAAGLGGVVHLDRPEDKLKVSEIPQMGAWVFEHAKSLRKNIDDLTFEGVVAGQMSPNVPTATGTAIQLGQARLRFGMPMTQLNLLGGECLGLFAKMTALRGERVKILGVVCGAEEFEGNYDFQVDFMSKDEGQRLRDTAAANEGYKLGTESFEGVQAAKGVADVTGKRREVTIDKARAMPVYMETVMGAVEVEFKRRVAERQAKEAAKNGTVPQPMPGGPEPPPAFTPMPGGPTQAAQVQQGMEQGLNRVMPGA